MINQSGPYCIDVDRLMPFDVSLICIRVIPILGSLTCVRVLTYIIRVGDLY